MAVLPVGAAVLAVGAMLALFVPGMRRSDAAPAPAPAGAAAAIAVGGPATAVEAVS